MLKKGDKAKAEKTKQEKSKEATIIEHLDELRKRILICAAFITVFAIFAYTKTDWMIAALKQPLGKVDLVFLTPIEGFMTKLKLAFVGGVILASPIIFLQTLLFISPALYKKEKILLFGSLPIIVALFFGGLAFSFLFIIPTTLKYLMSFGNEFMVPMLSVNKYYSFVTSFALIIGVIFELPLAMLVLTRFGILSYRTMAKKRKYALLVIVTVTAILTPTPDIFTLLAVSVPLLLLFELSLGVMFIYDKLSRRRKKKEAENELLEEVEEDEEEIENE